MKKLPIGRQNFEQLIQDDLLYVDKTRQIYELIAEGNLYFLSRPRRFGKSLLVSTLKEIFSGNKDLFKGLYLAEQTDYDWASYPVLSFNFAKTNNEPSALAGEAFTYQPASIVSDALIKMEQALEKGLVAQFIDQLKILLSEISYHLLPKNKTNQSAQQNFQVWEGYFHTIVYLITSFLGLVVQAEITKHQGRLDLLAQTDDFLYLMEFKLDEPIEDAIAQIKSRKYAESYKNSPKRILLVGIAFSKSERNVESWEEEEWLR